MRFLRRRAAVILPALLLVLLTVWVYQTVGTYGFMSMDDPEYVAENARVRRGLTGEGFSWALRTFHMGYWIPLTWLSFMADVEAFGFSPGAFHLVNLAFHVAGCLALLGAFVALTGRWWPSFTAALLFAVHPLHVESVVWITERKDVLSTLFWLLALWSYARYARAPGLLRYLAVAFFFVLGLMAKPLLVMLPVTLLLLDFWPLGRLRAGSSPAPRGTGPFRLSGRALALAEKIPLFLIAAAFAALTFSTQRSGGAVKSIGEYPLASRAANAVVSSLAYLGKTVWPVDLAVFYPHPGTTLPPGKVAVAAAALAALSVLAFLLRRSRPSFATGWLWYLVTLFPVSGLFQSGVQGMADRFAYVPSAGVFVAAAWGIGGISPARAPSQRLAACLAAIAAIAAGAFAVAARGQVAYWRSDVELFTHALRTTAPNDYTHMHLGAALWREGRDGEAIEHFRKGLAINPRSPWLHYNMGLAMQRQGRLADAERHYRQAAGLKADLRQALNNLGIILEQQGRLGEARRWYEQAIAADPDSAEAPYNLGILLYKSRDLPGAARSFERALKIDPAEADAQLLLGIVSREMGDVAKAVASLEQAVGRAPASAEARYQLGLALLGGGDPRRAARSFEEALRIQPGHAGARSQLAILGGP